MEPAGVFLETERMFFRKFCAEDAGLLFELDSDPEVMRFISKGKPTPLAQLETEILPRVLGYYRKSPPQGCWAAHLCDGGDFIGWFHLRPDKITPEEMELGYRLKRSAWGRGLATEGSQALLKKAFNEWDCPKVCARTLVDNLKSRRVMEKVGLSFECDFVYSLEACPDWTEEERHAVKYSTVRGKS
jgi:RimJ/RimL family protein N-acetyltransferase